MIIIYKNKCNNDELYLLKADLADPISWAKSNWNFEIDDFQISKELYRELISWVLDYQNSVDLFKPPSLPEDKKVEHDDNEVKIYKALGESTRLKIVKLLAGQSKLSCQEMANQLKGPANSTLTHHLKPLLDCGLLTVRKEGTFRFYSLQREVLAQHAPALL